MPVAGPQRQTWVGLFCAEMPESRFTDILIIANPNRNQALELTIDPTFRQVVIPESLVVTGLVPNQPVACGGEIERGRLRLRFACPEGQGPERVIVTISGIRRGRKDIRFPEFTEHQAQRNRDFWNQAYR